MMLNLNDLIKENEMALETLKGVKKIGAFDVLQSDTGSPEFARSSEFIKINNSENMIFLKLQNGSIKENGVNGCQLDTIIEAAKMILEGLNKNFPCRENAVAITKLDEALMWLEKRTKDRVARTVEGTSNK
jgi:hypothetical protein